MIGDTACKFFLLKAVRNIQGKRSSPNNIIVGEKSFCAVEGEEEKNIKKYFIAVGHFPRLRNTDVLAVDIRG